MAQGAIAQMSNDNFISALDAFGKRACASYFDIVRVATDSKNVHLHSLDLIQEYC
jgi:hypothetical protein